MIRSYKGMTPRLGERVYVDESAQVIGDVELGDHASVWMNAVLRGDVHSIRIGAYSNVQDNCVVHVFKADHPTVVADHVTVGHSVTLHGCRIDSYCLIGMGATILNGAKIGEGSIVAAGAVVPEGREFPPGSLIVGIPAKRVADVNEEQAADIERGASAYVERAASHRRSLERGG
jgi:carbonic anhydrase/acetyltransferase-like protein (isoleucine patch superfamily)